MAEKKYCGNAKMIETKYGDLIKHSFTAEDLKVLQDNLDNGWVNTVTKERKEPSKGGMTHYVEVDDWKPEGLQTKTTGSQGNIDYPETINPDDIPF